MNKKVIFIHIPKTGGVAIGDALLKTSWFNLTEPRHLTAATLKEKMGEEEFNSNFIFTMIRNPWDRLVSTYHFLQHGATDVGPHSHAALKKFKELNFLSFEDFVNRLYIFNKNEQDIYWSRNLNKDENIQTLKQVNWVFDKDGKCLIDFIGLFHEFDESLKELTTLLNQNPLIYERINTTSHLYYQELYTPEMTSKVAELYQEDIETFNFTFPNKE